MPREEARQRLVYQVNPRYPPAAESAGVAGVVKLEAIINESGEVAELKVVSGHPLLVPAALNAVRKWKYTPFTSNGQPVEAITEVEVGVEPGAGEAGQPPEYKEWQQYFDSGQQAYEQGDYAAAERNLEQARPRAEALPEKYWLQRVLTLHYLGRTQFSQKKYPEAGRWFERELTLLEENRTPDQPETAQALRALGELYQAVDEPAKSESYYLRAIPLLEHLLDETAMEETRWSYARQLARTLAQLGVIYQEQARQGPAERAFRRAVAIAEKTPDVDELVFSLHHYAKLLRQVGREEEAAAVEARLLSLRVTAPK